MTREELIREIRTYHASFSEAMLSGFSNDELKRILAMVRKSTRLNYRSKRVEEEIREMLEEKKKKEKK